MPTLLLSLLIAVAADTVIGDPQWRLHPVRLAGTVASFFERMYRDVLSNESIAGIITWWSVTIVTMFAAAVPLIVAKFLGDAFFVAVSALCIYFSIAPRDLAKHAVDVARALRMGDIAEARKRTGRMVSRDVSRIGRDGLVRAVIESTAENVVDGATAPLLFAALFGPLGAVFYRTVNTMDAMFGYKNERYLRFGRFAAKADDVCAWLPARITGPLLCLSAPPAGGSFFSAVRMLRRDRNNHESPNAGIAESAAAGAMGIRLGGPGSYFGTVVNKPYLGDPLREPTVSDIRRMIVMMYGATLLTAALSAAMILLKTHIVEGLS